MDTRLSRVEDTALIDAIQQVQLFYTKADVSFASSFNPRVSVPAGRSKYGSSRRLYLYDNELWTVQGNGQDGARSAGERCAILSDCAGDCSHGPLINPRVIGYNFDMAQGVDYEIDLTQPPGHRIRNLRWHGQPLCRLPSRLRSR